MGYHNNNWVDDTNMEFPRGGFWLVHILGTILIFMWGMSFAARRAPLPIIGYRFLRRMMGR